MNKKEINPYARIEEQLNVISHFIGIIISLLGTFLLLEKANSINSKIHWVTYAIFGASMIILFTASTLYHASTNFERRKKLKIFDHIAIYFLIAGTYTPFTLLALKGAWGWSIFTVVWLIALAGIVLKLFFTGRFKLISTLSYVLMGWIVVIAAKPLIAFFPRPGLMWIAAGGIFYTVGALIYSLKRIAFNHAIFHLFVLGGAFSLYMAILLFT